MLARRSISHSAARKKTPRPLKSPSLQLQRSEEPSRPPLTPVHLRRRIEGKIISLLLSTLTEEFPEKTVRDTVRYLLKASATRGFLHFARTTGKRGRSDPKFDSR